ncbi:MAG TPA: LPS assembly protein LptD [Steroidobacteraceae bacterium]|nr:LPS assembly protein LptD [Steroidobacteraceae bacterium]
MQRPNPIWLALLSFGALTPVAEAAEQSCSAPVVPALLPRVAQTSPARPKGEKGVATGGAIEAQGDQVDYDQATDTATFTGNVVVRQGERLIKADKIQIIQKKNVKGEGGVDYTDPIVHILGDGGDYSATEGADFRSAKFELLQRPARGAAETMNLTPEGILNLQSVTFTTCPADDESWSLTAKDIKLDTRAKIGEARDAKIEFKGVPILYLPYVSFPLGDERKSGFLFPTIGSSSRGGLELAVPYYWNIAPNMDFTGEPFIYSRRGIDLGGDFRYLEPGSKGELIWHYLPHDAVFDGSRSDVRLRNTTQLTDDFRLSIDAENVSDSQYFQDFSQGPEGTSTAFVERRATFSYRDDHWRVDGEAQQYQTIDNTLVVANRPYARAPAITASADFGWGPGSLIRYGFDSEIVNFDRDISHISNCLQPGVTVSPCVTGWRADVMPAVSLNLDGPGYFFRPAGSFRATQYELENTLPGEDKSPSRTLPIASVDAGLQFERDLGSAGKRKLTLEPRMLYLYAPYRDQNDLPVFDTALPDLVPVELFRNNRYVGADRVSDANQVAMGLTSRLLDGHDGRQFVAATIGQIYYFETPRVVLPYEVPPSGTRSDFVAQLAVNAFQDWNSSIGLQWSPQSSQIERTDVNIQYKPAPDKVINVAYRFERGTIHPASQCNIIDATGTATNALTAAQYSQAGICGFEQVEVSGAWPIAGHWNAFAREVYSLQDKQPLESFAGFEYGSCCWRVRFGARRYVSRRPLTPLSTEAGPQDTAAWLQLELTGLASVGSASDSFLIDEIRGYTRPESSQNLFKGP